MIHQNEWKYNIENVTLSMYTQNLFLLFLLVVAAAASVPFFGVEGGWIEIELDFKLLLIWTFDLLVIFM
jgi:hypothetical protein